MNNIIKRIQIEGLWGKYNIDWDNIHPDVNILVGLNGSGKTTLLKIVEETINNENTGDYFLASGIEFEGGYNILHSSYLGETIYNFDTNLLAINVNKINTFDNIPANNEKTVLDDLLYKLIYNTGGSESTFGNYRLKATNYPDEAGKINNDIRAFFKLIDDFFKQTGKSIEIDLINNNLTFKQDDITIQLNELSSGEKQLLYILFTVFLMEKQPFVFLLDGPEISLHMEWQQKLISVIQMLNPNCQLIVATHSPGIINNLWNNKVTFIHNIIHKMNQSE